jgi:protein tyrosine/serine phosphatase
VQRLIELEGCLNFRDLGGYPTADGRTLVWRRIYRSDGLHRLTKSDCARIRDELRVTDLVDLRSSAELSVDGRGLLENEPLAFHHVPLFDGNTSTASFEVKEMTLADRYLGLAEVAKPAIARVVTIVAEAEGGTVYHCAAGKDRTGVISAILLSALGVSDELIVADYALTQQNLDAIVARLGESEGYKTMLDALPPDTLHADPQTMVSLLEQLRERYGSAEGYLESADIGDEVLARLRGNAIV